MSPRECPLGNRLSRDYPQKSQSLEDMESQPVYGHSKAARPDDSRNRLHQLEMDFEDALYEENKLRKKLSQLNEESNIRLALEDENKKLRKRVIL